MRNRSLFLSSDLATLFTGRTMKVKVYPFSYEEYLNDYGINDHYDDAFDRYIKWGGIARAYEYKMEEKQNDYTRDIYSTI